MIHKNSEFAKYLIFKTYSLPPYYNFSKVISYFKCEIHQTAVIYRGHPSCHSNRLQLLEKVKTLIYCGLENSFYMFLNLLISPLPVYL